MSNPAKSLNTNPPTKLQKELLAEIVAAANSPTGFTYVAEGKAKPLVDRGLIEVNPAMKNDAGHVAARATNAGISIIMENKDATPAAAESNETAAPNFAIDSDIPMPAVNRRRKSAMYPFDTLEVGQSFHVPATNERPNPAKSLASTVSSANKRYAEVIPGETRVDRKGNTVPATKPTRLFRVFEAASDDPRGAGARVFRVQ